MFRDTSRYLDNIFTIDNLEFEKHFLIYPTDFQVHKANTSDKETSVPHLKKNKQVTFIPAVMTNAMTSDFLSSNSPG